MQVITHYTTKLFDNKGGWKIAHELKAVVLKSVLKSMQKSDMKNTKEVILHSVPHEDYGNT